MRLSSIATNLFSLKESKYFPPSVLINQYFLLGAIDSALVMMLSKVEYIAARTYGFGKDFAGADACEDIEGSVFHCGRNLFDGSRICRRGRGKYTFKAYSGSRL